VEPSEVDPPDVEEGFDAEEVDDPPEFDFLGLHVFLFLRALLRLEGDTRDEPAFEVEREPCLERRGAASRPLSPRWDDP
jgi:hypothetical protein